MARGKMGGNNLGNLMKQAQKMQVQMQKAQEELEATDFEGQSGGGVVKVIFTGKKQMKEITIEPEAVDPDDVEMLQDLITAAINQAIEKIDEASSDKMGHLSGGMNIPGL